MVLHLNNLNLIIVSTKRLYLKEVCDRVRVIIVTVTLTMQLMHSLAVSMTFALYLTL